MFTTSNKNFVPVILKELSSCGKAIVLLKPKSVPQCGSVKFIVPLHSPEVNLGKYKFLISSEAFFQ